MKANMSKRRGFDGLNNDEHGIPSKGIIQIII
jgi:hypothetical protein